MEEREWNVFEEIKGLIWEKKHLNFLNRKEEEKIDVEKISGFESGSWENVPLMMVSYIVN